jgi:predicted enzyme related to lactoylglutathione lyase
MINAIAFFVYPVTDMARARKFYEGTLGLKVGMNFDEKWVEYEIAGQTLAITGMDIGHKPGVKGGAVALEVDDYDQEIARLKELKANFLMDTYDTPVCRFAVLTDPDGNDVMIHKRKS